MNKRIEKLMIESGLFSYDGDMGQYEKFAELIVRECASVVKKEMDYDANWCDDKILKHFGVE